MSSLVATVHRNSTRGDSQCSELGKTEIRIGPGARNDIVVFGLANFQEERSSRKSAEASVTKCSGRESVQRKMWLFLRLEQPKRKENLFLP